MIKTRDLRKAFTTAPPLDFLGGGRVARAHRLHTAHVQADNLLGNGRNVVARVGLHGCSAFHIASVDPVSFTQVYPLRTVSRVVARTPAFAVLPGHFLRLSALVVPSGMTGQFAGATWFADIPYGRIDVTITWTGSPGTVITTDYLQLPTSAETWAAENPEAGASWSGLRRFELPLVFPASVLTSAADRQAWSEGVTAEVSIAYRGGVRAVDVVVQQIPTGYARDVGVDTTYSSPVITNGIGATVQAYPVAFPVEERGAADPTYGSVLLADIADRQQHVLGPVLAQWTAWGESGTPVGTTASPSASTTSTSFVGLLRSGTAWASTRAGWSLSAASHAQQFKSSNARRELRGKNACVPVRCWAYCAGAAATNSVIRWQTESYSIAELTFTGTTPAWRSCTGHLRAGAHPEDESVLEVFGKAAAANTLHLYHFLIEYLDL